MILGLNAYNYPAPYEAFFKRASALSRTVSTVLNSQDCDQFQISPAASQDVFTVTQYEELGFSSLTQMEDYEYTTNSHYLTFTILFKRWENALFELGSKRQL